MAQAGDREKSAEVVRKHKQPQAEKRLLGNKQQE